MKIPKHQALDQLDNWFDDLNITEPKTCSYKGSDITHVEGECFYCDYDRVKSKEESSGLHWLDRTEVWDYYDWWYSKKESK